MREEGPCADTAGVLFALVLPGVVDCLSARPGPGPEARGGQGWAYDAEMSQRRTGPGQPPPARRVLDAAYTLFSRRGIRNVGVDEIVAASGVAMATFYRHFRSKDDLVLAYLARRNEERRSAVEAAIRAEAGRGAEALLAVFDVFEGWFGQDAPEVGAFVQVLIEMGPDTRLADPAGLAWSFHILVQRAIVADLEGDPQAAGHARTVVALLLEDHRPPTPHP